MFNSISERDSAGDKYKEYLINEILQNRRSLKTCGAFKNDPDVVLYAVTRDGLSLQDAGNEIKKMDGIVMQAIMQNKSALKYADPSLRSNPDFLLKVIEEDPLIDFNFICETSGISFDKNFFMKAFEIFDKERKSLNPEEYEKKNVIAANLHFVSQNAKSTLNPKEVEAFESRIKSLSADNSNGFFHKKPDHKIDDRPSKEPSANLK